MPQLVRRDYTANGGWETFLSYEDVKQDILIGLLRLRKCSPLTFRPELKKEQCSIVRELHVYGSVVPVQARDPTKFQHQVPTILGGSAPSLQRRPHPPALHLNPKPHTSPPIAFCVWMNDPSHAHRSRPSDPTFP